MRLRKFLELLTEGVVLSAVSLEDKDLVDVIIRLEDGREFKLVKIKAKVGQIILCESETG